MKPILQKLLSAPLAIINWSMFLVGLGGAITFFGEAIEGLSVDGFDSFIEDLFGFWRKLSATFLIGGASGLFFSFTRNRTFRVATGKVASSAWLGLAALVLLMQAGITVLVAHPLEGLIRQNIDLFMVMETELQTAGKAGEIRLAAAGVLLFGAALAAGASLVCLIGAVCPLFYVLFSLEGTPRLCLRSACLQIAWLMALFYLQDLLQAGEKLLTAPGSLDIGEITWFASQKAAIGGVSRQLNWLLPGALISAAVVVIKARESEGDAAEALSGSGAMVAAPNAHAPVSAPLPDRRFSQDFYSIKYRFISNPLYKVFSVGSLDEPQLLIARMPGWSFLTRKISLRPVLPKADKPVATITIIGHRLLLFPKSFAVAENSDQKLGTLVLRPGGWVIIDAAGTQIGSIRVDGYGTGTYGVFFRHRLVCRMRFERIMRPAASLDFEGMNANAQEKKLCIALALVECFKSVAFNYQYYSGDG